MTITKSGELASFYTVNKAPIKHLKVYFSPKQTGEGTPSPENVRPIIGKNSINLTHSGKNLLNTDECQLINMSQSNGVFTNTVADTRNPINFTLIEQNGPDANQFTRECFYIATSTTGKFIQNITINNEDTTFLLLKHNGASKDLRMLFKWTAGTGNFRFTAEIDGANTTTIGGFTLHDIQITKLDDNNDYEKYVGGTTTIDWSAAAGTLYSGYVDLITGELVQEYDYISKPWKNWTSATILGNNTRKVCVTSSTPIGGNAAATSLCNLTNNYLWSNSDDSTHFYVANSSNTIYAILPNTLDENQEVQISYKLKTPITHQLTPQQLQTLLGRNNIWSNADRVEIEYDLAESNDELYRRRNILLRSAPHIETASGNFETDIAAPIKSAIVRFSPVQEGEGNPSPENIRPISGWTGLTAYHSGENLYVPNPDNKGYINVSGAIKVDTTSTYTDLIPVTAGETYSFKCTTVRVPEGTTNRRLHGYDSNGNWVMQITNRTTAAATVEDVSMVVTIPSGVSYIRASFRNQDTNVRVAKENAISVNWSAEAGTIYGGYVDLATGEVVENYAIITVDSQKDWLMRSISGHGAASLNVSDFNSGMIKADTISIFNYVKYITGSSEIADWTGRIANSGLITIFVPSDINTRDDMNNYIAQHNLQICYELATPITRQLTPTQLKTLRGPNSIWSTANGNIELSYWTH